MATWHGGPMDGTRVKVSSDDADYVVAFDSTGRVLPRSVAQRYADDPAAWLTERRTDVSRVAVYPIAMSTWSARRRPVILWMENPVEIIG